MKESNRGTTLRVIIIALFALSEIAFVYYAFHQFSEKAVYVEAILRIVSVIIILWIVNNSAHLSSDMMWIILISLFPIFGTVTYLLIGGNLFISNTYRSILAEEKKAAGYYVQNEEVLTELTEKDSENIGQFRYISLGCNYPIYRNSSFTYYELGDKAFPEMLEALNEAKEYIFMEYFIIEEGFMWNSVLEVLERKAKEGLDVRVMYDDVGSMLTLNVTYASKLQEKGIKCMSFNRVNPIINIIINHRDHRKIMVIDGKVAFSGGINLADEYINLKEKYGHWKDNCFRIEGEAVWSYTVMFLTNWNALRHEDEDYLKFKYDFGEETEMDGYIAPYADTPLDNELVGQNVYLNIINQANNYVYIATPYLVIDTDVRNALVLAAKRGVDVRIITPGIPDKKIVYQVTRSFYEHLINGGVKIYEYTPGFIHSKVFVSDDKIASTGTINLDFRSLYLHFENNTYLYNSEAVLDIKKDMTDTMALSREIHSGEIRFGLIKGMLIATVRIFSGLL